MRTLAVGLIINAHRACPKTSRRRVIIPDRFHNPHDVYINISPRTIYELTTHLVALEKTRQRGLLKLALEAELVFFSGNFGLVLLEILISRLERVHRGKSNTIPKPTHHFGYG